MTQADLPAPARPEDQIAGPRVGAVARTLALAGGAVLIGVAGLTTTSVILRGLTGSGITGEFELVQLGAAISAFCLFPLCVATRSNIFVDTFTERLPRRWQNGLDALWEIVLGLVVGVIAWRMSIGAYEQYVSKATLQMLPVPIWWAVAICAGLATVFAVTATVVGLRRARRGS